MKLLLTVPTVTLYFFLSVGTVSNAGQDFSTCSDAVQEYSSLTFKTMHYSMNFEYISTFDKDDYIDTIDKIYKISPAINRLCIWERAVPECDVHLPYRVKTQGMTLNQMKKADADKKLIHKTIFDMWNPRKGVLSFDEIVESTGIIPDAHNMETYLCAKHLAHKIAISDVDSHVMKLVKIISTSKRMDLIDKWQLWKEGKLTIQEIYSVFDMYANEKY